MDLIVNKVMQLEVVHITDGDAVIELLTGTAIVNGGLAVAVELDLEKSMIWPFSPMILGSLGGISRSIFHRATARGRYRRYRRCQPRGQSRRRGHDLDAASLGCVAEVDFQNLTDVHTGRNAQRVQHDVQRGAVGQVGHILLRQDAGNDTLVAVAAGHLIADADLTLLGDVAADDLAHTGLQLIAVLRGKDLDIHKMPYAPLGHTQRGIAHLAGFLTEDGTQQALLSSQLGLTLPG